MGESRLFIITLIFCAIIVSPRAIWAQIPDQRTDGETLGVLSVIDQIEIQTAKLAQEKNPGPAVLEYAKMLDEEHSQHLLTTQNLSRHLGIPIVDNTLSGQQLRNSSEEDLAALIRVDGEAFAQLYIADMIKGHSNASNWIESQGAQNGQVKDFLNDTKKHVDMHLKKAMEIQKHQSIGPTQS